MSKAYDAIVIGGGHNGLVNACYLAKAGLKTVLLERRHLVGGATITEELLEGFQFTTFSYAVSLLRPDIVEDLELAKHGLMILPMPNTFQPGYNGEYLLLGADKDANYHEIARHSIEDAEGYKELGYLIDRVCFALKPWMDRIPPNQENDSEMVELKNRMNELDGDVRAMLDQFINCSAVEILDQFIESNIVKAMIASSGIIGSQISPRDPKSGLVWLFHKLGEYDGVSGDWGFHKNGNGGLTQVMARAFESFSGEIRLNAGVDKVLYADGVATGVRLADSSQLTADIVVSALDPKLTFTKLVDPDDMPEDLMNAISNYKFQGSASKVNFALSGVPTFPGLEGRTDIFQGFTNVGPSLEYLDAAWKDCEAGRFSRRPFIDCCLQSTVDPDMSPPGKHVLSCFTMYTPYKLAESDWDYQRDNLGDAVEETLEEFFPGFRKLVIHREVVTPLDIERVVGLTEGNIFAGELFGPQMFMHRPAPGWHQYRTPIGGYYQCGSGTHPGGCVTGGPGKLAAKQIIGDLEQRNGSVKFM